MANKCELGTMTQKEDNGTYTAVIVMNNLDDESNAEAMCTVMAEAIEGYLSQRGVNPIIENNEIN